MYKVRFLPKRSEGMAPVRAPMTVPMSAMDTVRPCCNAERLQ